jgi:hypothetical protein
VGIEAICTVKTQHGAAEQRRSVRPRMLQPASPRFWNRRLPAISPLAATMAHRWYGRLDRRCRFSDAGTSYEWTWNDTTRVSPHVPGEWDRCATCFSSTRTKRRWTARTDPSVESFE